MVEQKEMFTGIQFVQPDQFPRLPDKQIHVWRFPVVSSEISFLSESEKIIVSRFRFDGDKKRFALGRHALRLLLSEYLSVKPMDISIVAEKGRKPFVSHPVSDIHFNISHSGDWVLIGFSEEELGIDIEKMEEGFNFENLLQEHFSGAERSFISAASDPVAAFYYLWTRKEAITKAWGTGIRENLELVPVLDSGSFIDLDKKSWKIESFMITSQYAAALAYAFDVKLPVFYDGSRLI